MYGCIVDEGLVGVGKKQFVRNGLVGCPQKTINIVSVILMNEVEYLNMKNYGDQGGCYRPITPFEISIILHMIRKRNSIIVLLFIQNNS